MALERMACILVSAVIPSRQSDVGTAHNCWRELTCLSGSLGFGLGPLPFRGQFSFYNNIYIRKYALRDAPLPVCRLLPTRPESGGSSRLLPASQFLPSSTQLTATQGQVRYLISPQLVKSFPRSPHGPLRPAAFPVPLPSLPLFCRRYRPSSGRSSSSSCRHPLLTPPLPRRHPHSSPRVAQSCSAQGPCATVTGSPRSISSLLSPRHPGLLFFSPQVA